MKQSFLTISALLLFLTNVHLIAQTKVNDSINLFRKKNVEFLIDSDSLSIYSNLQGVKYNPGYSNATEIPFFSNSHPLAGKAIINHFSLESLSLLYDISIDELVCNSAIGLYKLRKEMVEQFSLYESGNLKHNFINISFVANNSDVENGYFEVIYKSEKETIYVKHRKELEYITKPNNIEYYYIQSEKYYLYSSGKYYFIKSLNSLINTLNIFNDELKRFIKKQKFSKNKLIEKQIVETITYFDSLK
ncbi:MAG TPA: hypothetical protein VIK14_02075 [Ignavibacteria bacterium]